MTIAIQPESSPRPRSPMRARLLRALAQRRAAASGIPRRDPATGPVPASYAQAGLWLVTQLEQGPSAYNVPLPVRLRGRLDVAALRGALTGVVTRHEALRTTFTEQAGQVYQSIPAPAPVPLPVTDLTAADDAAREQAVARELIAAQTEPFDLFAGPVLRAGLLRLAPEEHLLLLTAHHIACDGWSVPILHTELAAGYNAAVRGTAADLPPLPVQYADYARWQREQLDPAELGRLTSYWRRRLGGAALTLPTDRPDGPAASTRGGMCSVPVPAEITARLDGIAREAGASRFMAVTGLLSLVLAGYTGQRDLLLGSTHAQRQQPELQSLIGLFNNAFPVRSDVSGNPSFRQLLARARHDLVADYQGSALPFGLLVDALQPERSGNRTPLIRVHFQLEERAGTTTAYEKLPDYEGLTAHGLIPDFIAAKFDLNFMVRADQEAMALDLVYRTDLFDAATAGQLADQFAQAAAAVAADPDLGIEDLPLPALARPQSSITVSATPAPASPVPASSDEAPVAGEPAPELLARVLDAWRQALGRDDVHPHADFFDIGGSSFTAIKVRRLLGGTVPLMELFRHRSAAALAAYLGSDAPAEDAGRLLWSLTPDESSATTTIVAIPYAGGNATVYQPLADALPPRFRLWAASLPGHEGEEADFIEFGEATRQLAAEVRDRVAGPVIVYGHCAGASLAVAVAQELEESGTDLKAVYVGASLTDPDAAQNLSRVTDSPSAELYEYIKAIGGFDGPLDDADRCQIIAALRHDMAGATQFQAAGHAAAEAGPARRLQAPMHCILGAADPVTPDPEHAYAGWSVFGDNITLDIVDGGHYFARDHAADLAGVIDGRSRQAVPVVCLPHTGAGASFFHPWQQQLAVQADIIAPDLAGHEKRFGDEPHRATAEAVADLLPRVLAAVGERDDVVVFGHCLGATVAFELAEGLVGRGVRIRHLILSGAPGPTVPRPRLTTGLPDEEFLARLEELASYSHPALADPEMAALLLPVLRADQEMYETYQRAAVEPLDAPITVLRGSADQLVSAADTEQWQQATTQPVRYLELAGGHMYLADDAGTVLDLIAEVTRTPAPAPAPAPAADSASQPDPNPAPAPAPAGETTPDAAPESQPGSEVSPALAEDRLAALLAAEYPQPDWGLPDAGAPARHKCSEDLGAVSDACVLAAAAAVLGRFHGLPVTALAVREPARADAAPPGPALVALPTGLQDPAGDLLTAAAQALDVPWPRLDDTLTAMLGGTAEDSATGNSTPAVELRFGLHGELDAGRALTLTVVAAPGRHLRLLAAARRDVIGARATVQFTRSVAHVAGQLAAARPDAGLDSLEPLSDAERVLVRRLGTARRKPPAENRRIDQLVADRAAAAPRATAITDGRSRLSYGALDTAASRTAHALRELGVQPGDRVGVCLERSWELVIVLLGVLRAGAAYLPMEPGNPPGRQARMTGTVAPSVVVTSLDAFPAGPYQVVSPADLATVARRQPGTPPEPAGGDGDAAYVICTSGSTGQPKAVAVAHRSVTALIGGTGTEFGFTPADVWALFHSVAFDMSVWEIWGALTTGGRLVVVPQGVTRSPADLHGLLADERVTILNQTPTAFGMLLDADADADAGRRLALRLVTFGGEPLDTRTLVPWFRRYPPQECRMVNLYGITETTVHSSWVTLTPQLAQAASRSVGVPLPGESLTVRDQAGRLLPPGVAGEIYVGGVGVALGYHGQPELTAQRFSTDSDTGVRVYRSGDRGRLFPDGTFEHLGRLDGQVKLRGYRIELGEVGAALLAADGIAAAVVVVGGAADSAAARLDAYVVPDRRAPAPDLAQVRRHVRGLLPEYMVPATVTVLDALPLTVNGKLDRARLPRPGAIAPSAPNELLLAIWENLTGLPTGPDDNIFDVGGNSVVIGRLVNELHARGLPRLALREVYRAPTLRQLASLLGTPAAA